MKLSEASFQKTKASVKKSKKLFFFTEALGIINNISVFLIKALFFKTEALMKKSKP